MDAQDTRLESPTGVALHFERDYGRLPVGGGHLRTPENSGYFFSLFGVLPAVAIEPLFGAKLLIWEA